MYAFKAAAIILMTAISLSAFAETADVTRYSTKSMILGSALDRYLDSEIKDDSILSDSLNKIIVIVQNERAYRKVFMEYIRTKLHLTMTTAGSDEIREVVRLRGDELLKALPEMNRVNLNETEAH